ncbi:MAG: MGH1-like glycoside hydrolase domain-containing protein [Opitutaceae bacterium]
MPRSRALGLLVRVLSALSAASASAQVWHPLGPPRFHVGDVHTDQVVSFDDSSWSTSPPPAFAGSPTWVSWHFRPGTSLRGRDLLVRLGQEHAANLTTCDGASVAGGLGQGRQAVFLVPGLLARAGADNVVAVRVTDVAGWAALRRGEFGWITLDAEAPRLSVLARRASATLERTFAPLGPAACDFLLRGLRLSDLAKAERSTDRSRKIAENWRRLREIQADPARYARDWRFYARGNALEFMRDSEEYLVPDFTGNAVQRPAMGSELSDFGSWYDIAYSGGTNRFYIGSVRQGVGPTHEFFNTARDVALLALYVRTGSGELIDGDGPGCSVAWYPYGWRTTTLRGGLEIESRAFFTRFDTLAITGRVSNRGRTEARIAPGLFVTARSNYDGRTGGRITGRSAAGGRILFRNVRAGLGTQPALYGDTLAIGSSLLGCRAGFADRLWPTARGDDLREALGRARSSTLDAPAGSARLQGPPTVLRPGASVDFVFVVAAAAGDARASASCDAALRKWTRAPRAAVAHVEADWRHFLGGLPRLEHPSYPEAKLYYAAATALRKNRYLYRDEGRLYSASFPARGGFNYFYQSDSCWNLLGYLDFRPSWAEGHAVPILVPPCEIMDPHFFWSMWELYSRLPDPDERRAFAARVYPLLERAYQAWLTEVDTDGDLLVATPDNWDDNPRYDLFFERERYVPGWNSWWNDLVRACRQAPLDDPAPSSQLGYGAVVLGRFARILGRTDDARQWDRQLRRHIAAVDSLWDAKLGYWTVSYRHSERDDVLTSSIIYPIFTDLCRDPARIRRVIETRLLNPAEFDGRFPIPTVAYDDPRYYHQKPPFQNLPGGLWRGNLWMPEAWIAVKGLYKYGYEAEARRIAARLVDMMAHQSASVGPYAAFSFSPAEWYDSRTGLAQNNRAFSWSSAVALDLLLGNYQNERVLGANPARDGSVDGAVREIYSFADDRRLFRVYPGKTVFPRLHMESTDGRPIERSRRVEFTFTDPAGNFPGASIAFAFDETKWRIVRADTGAPLRADADGLYRTRLGSRLALLPVGPFRPPPVSPRPNRRAARPGLASTPAARAFGSSSEQPARRSEG